MPIPKPHLFLAFIVLLSALAGGCSRKTATPVPAAGGDTLHTADSSAATVAVPVLSYEQAQGKDVFMKYCAVCHGTEGKGDGFNAFNLDPKPRNLSDGQYMSTLTDERLTQTIQEGGRGVNRSSLMPSWGARLTKNEILDVAAFVRTLVDTTTAAK